MRFLRCFDCGSLESFVDPPKGVDPHNISPGEDPLLDELIARHTTNGNAHVGQLIAVKDEDWNNPDEEKRKEIRKQVMESLGRSTETTGFDQEFYDVRDTFQADAMDCYNQHGRPAGRCIDWLDDRKALGRATPEGRAWQAQNRKAPQTYLCHFCVVASHVRTEIRLKNGEYKG